MEFFLSSVAAGHFVGTGENIFVGSASTLEVLSGDGKLIRREKILWGPVRHIALFPVDANRADYETLLRVPGIGVRSAKRILAARRERRPGGRARTGSSAPGWPRLFRREKGCIWPACPAEAIRK